MTVRELDHLIGRMLSHGPQTVPAIHAEAVHSCSVYDVAAGLRIWARNGWAREIGDGRYELITVEVN